MSLDSRKVLERGKEEWQKKEKEEKKAEEVEHKSRYEQVDAKDYILKHEQDQKEGKNQDSFEI